MDNPNKAIIESFKERGLETETEDLNGRDWQDHLNYTGKFIPFYTRELPAIRLLCIEEFLKNEDLFTKIIKKGDCFPSTYILKQAWLERTNIRIFRPSLYERLWLAYRKSILKPHKPWRIHGQTPSAFTNALTVSNSFRFRW